MKILFICDEYPPGKNGGIGTAVQVLSRELVKQGHSVYVAGLCSYVYGGASYEVDEGVKVWRKRYGLNIPLSPDHPIMNKIPAFIRQFLNGRQAFNRFVRFISELVHDEKIEVIEIPDWNTFATCVGFIVKWPSFQVPLIVKSHGSYTYFSHEAHTALKKRIHSVDVELYRRADALSAVSLYTAEVNRKLFNISRPIKVLYNSLQIPDQKITAQRDDFTVLFTGSMIAKKGIFQLMKAWNLVHMNVPQAKLRVFGRGDAQQVAALLNEECRQSVYFGGHISRELLYQELSVATLAVFPSYSECFALGPMEATAFSCPVIYTTRSSGPELISHGVDGLLVDPDHVEELAGAIMKLLADKQLRTSLAGMAQKKIREEFSISRSAAQHIAFYQQVIADFKKP
jgi:glycosyltransferase involved in cell wall biosynthesis